MSPKRHYLQSVRGWFRYRRRWPKHVQAIAPGEFYIRHLNTSDLQEAIRLRPACDSMFNAEVARLERRLDSKPRPLTETEAHDIVLRWLAARVRDDER